MQFYCKISKGWIIPTSEAIDTDAITRIIILDQDNDDEVEIDISADVDIANIPEQYAPFTSWLGKSIVDAVIQMREIKTLAEQASYIPSSSLYDRITHGRFTLLMRENKIYGIHIDSENSGVSHWGDEMLAIFGEISYYECGNVSIENSYEQPSHQKDVYRMMQSLVGLPADVVIKYVRKIVPTFNVGVDFPSDRTERWYLRMHERDAASIGNCTSYLVKICNKLNKKGLLSKHAIVIPKGEGPYVAIKNDAIYVESYHIINGGVALVHENQWNVIEKYYSCVDGIARDHDGQGYEYDRIQVIRNLSPDVVKFIQQIQDKEFINRVFRRFREIATFEE